jgi:hypothetical protein
MTNDSSSRVKDALAILKESAEERRSWPYWAKRRLGWQANLALDKPILDQVIR